MLACLGKGSEIPQVKITVRSSCCNTHSSTFYVHKSQVGDLLSSSIKKYAMSDIRDVSSPDVSPPDVSPPD